MTAFRDRDGAGTEWCARRLAAVVSGHMASIRPDLRESAKRAVVDVLDDGPVSTRDVAELLNELVRCLYLSGEQQVIIDANLAVPGYNPGFDLGANAAGPWMEPPAHPPAFSGRKWSLLDTEIGVPIGLPASVLTLNSKYVRFYAQCGFNVITYKTVRTREYPPYEPPQWLFLQNESEPWAIGDIPQHVTASPCGWPSEPRMFSTANSFGVPSPDPQQWTQDVELAQSYLSRDQLLILSVMGTKGDGKAALAADYRLAIHLGVGSGVHFFEVNLSCPNLANDFGEETGLICQDRELTRRIVESCREAMPNGEKLIAKISWMQERAFRDVFEDLLRQRVLDGVTGINSVQTEVRREGFEEAFVDRLHAGISGVAIRNYAIDFLSYAVRLRNEIGWDFAILHCGGIMNAQDATVSLELGADAALSATGALMNPGLAADVVESLGGPPASSIWDPDGDGEQVRETSQPSATRILTELQRMGGSADVDELQRHLSATPEALEQAISDSADVGALSVTTRRGKKTLTLSSVGRRVAAGSIL